MQETCWPPGWLSTERLCMRHYITGPPFSLLLGLFRNNLQTKAHNDKTLFTDEPERRNPSQVLTDMVARLSHLDLRGKVAKIGTHGKSGGSYSDIFQGRLLSNGKLVAIRELRAHIFPEAELKKSIALELRIWSDLDHPNILPLLGFSLEFGPHPAFITEWMSNGTVLDYVKANAETSVLHLSIGIAAGLRYLHEREIVHADIKSSNVLVSPNGVPLLIDFGLSRLLVISQVIMSTREAGGTFRWMAYELCGGIPPEHWRDSIKTVTTKETDVWAYGMTVLELLTKSYPYSHLKTDFQVFSAIGKGSLPRKPSNLKSAEERALWEDICNPCWSRTASRRPTMSELSEDLRDIEHSVNESSRIASTEDNNHVRLRVMSLPEVPIEQDRQVWRQAVIQPPLPSRPPSPPPPSSRSRSPSLPPCPLPPAEHARSQTYYYVVPPDDHARSQTYHYVAPTLVVPHPPPQQDTRENYHLRRTPTRSSLASSNESNHFSTTAVASYSAPTSSTIPVPRKITSPSQTLMHAFARNSGKKTKPISKLPVPVISRSRSSRRTDNLGGRTKPDLAARLGLWLTPSNKAGTSSSPVRKSFVNIVRRLTGTYEPYQPVKKSPPTVKSRLTSSPRTANLRARARQDIQSRRQTSSKTAGTRPSSVRQSLANLLPWHPKNSTEAVRHLPSPGVPYYSSRSDVQGRARHTKRQPPRR